MKLKIAGNVLFRIIFHIKLVSYKNIAIRRIYVPIIIQFGAFGSCLVDLA